MIAFLKGNLVEVSDGKAVIEVHGIGYRILISAGDAQKLAGMENPILLHTHFQVREDAFTLFGFLAKEDLEVFQMLIGVNGIGPKAALGILSAFTASDLKFAVLAADAKMISKAPGIGLKTAQKLILELKDKFSLMDTFEESIAENTPASMENLPDQNRNEAIQALVALGYPSAEALKAVRSVADVADMSTEDLLRAALKKMAF